MQPKTALIAGGAGGIGAATVRAFQNDGWNTVVWDAKAPADATLDLTDEDAVRRAAEALPHLDAVVHVAGLGNRDPVEHVDLDQWRRVLEVNLVSVVVLAQTVLPLLKQRRGCFVAVSSVAATRWFRNRSAYCASKAGLNALVGCLAMEWADHGVRVFAVSPGFTEAPIARESINAGLTSLDDILRHTPQGRMLDADEIGNAIHALTSPVFAAVTGSEILVDGGFAALSGF